MKTDCRVAAINWNGKEFIVPMIESLLPQLKETDSCLMVFDNGSTDGSAELVEAKFGDTGLVFLHRNHTNIGFGPAANEIIGNSDLPVVVLVNTDTVVKPGCLKTLLDTIEIHRDVAFAGPRLLWPDGSLQRSKRDFPFPANLVLENIPLLRKRTAKYSDHRESGYTDWLIGAMMAIRTEPFNSIGGFSDQFMFFHEETDLQFRLQEHGWKTWFESTARVIHYEGGSCRQVFGRMVYLQHIPGKLIFLERNGSSRDVFMYRLLMTALQLERLLTGVFRKQNDPRWTGKYCSRALRLLWKREQG